MQPKVIFEDNHLLVVEKPINMPVQEDASRDPDLLNWCKKYLKEKYNKPGNVFVGLVHRLDCPVGGVMVFARTSKAASRLSEQIRNNEVKKTYLAVVDGTPESKQGELHHRLEKDKKKNIVRVSEHGKDSSLKYEVLQSKNNISLVKIRLITGRSHQIRVQFQAIGHSLIGDAKYGKDKNPKTTIALWAHELEFKHPTRDEMLHFKANPPSVEPWNLFL
jgi:23S rRNA pseudouridine1911/1915/1917 synthase